MAFSFWQAAVTNSEQLLSGKWSFRTTNNGFGRQTTSSVLQVKGHRTSWPAKKDQPGMLNPKVDLVYDGFFTTQPSTTN
jgi:hypothetical protein